MRYPGAIPEVAWEEGAEVVGTACALRASDGCPWGWVSLVDCESPRQSATGSWQEQQRGGQLAGLGVPGVEGKPWGSEWWPEGPVD